MGDFFDLTMEVKTLVEEHGRFRASLNDIRSHDDTDSRCDELELDFEVIGLPQHRLIPVRNVEPITISAMRSPFPLSLSEMIFRLFPTSTSMRTTFRNPCVTLI